MSSLLVVLLLQMRLLAAPRLAQVPHLREVEATLPENIQKLEKIKIKNSGQQTISFT